MKSNKFGTLLARYCLVAVSGVRALSSEKRARWIPKGRLKNKAGVSGDKLARKAAEGKIGVRG